MLLEIKDRHDLTIVPLHILRNPALSFELKGIAAMLYSFEGLHGTTDELANILGVSESQVTAYFRELQNAGYENIFRLYENGETDEKAAERRAAAEGSPHNPNEVDCVGKGRATK